LPGPTAGHFDDQGPSQSDSDEDQEAEGGNVGGGGFEADGADYISGDQKVEAEQEGFAELVFVAFECAGLVHFAEEPDGAALYDDLRYAGDDHSDGDELDEESGPLDCDSDELHQGGTV
jgi:hypothetical protein